MSFTQPLIVLPHLKTGRVKALAITSAKRSTALPEYPTIDRDLNLVVDEAVRWSDVAATIRAAGGPLTASFELKGDPFRDEKRLGPGKKSLLVALLLQSRERTLTSGEADDVRARIVEACGKNHGATLRA